MKQLCIFLAAGVIASCNHAVAQKLSADEIAFRMHLQAGTQTVVPGIQQGVGREAGDSNGLGVTRSLSPPNQKRTSGSESATNGISAAESGQIELQILFEFSSPKLARVAMAQLRELCAAFQMSGDIKRPFAIIGHTDAVGNQAYNLKLSIERAQAVRRYLIDECGIAPERVEADGKGENQLRAGLNPRDPLHRRVELKITK